MKKIVLLLVFLFVSSFYAQAKQDLFRAKLKVGSKPFCVKTISREFLLILCEGIDQNGNGQFDEGDEYPSAWISQQFIAPIINPGEYEDVDQFFGSVKKIHDFEMGAFSYPFNGDFFVLDYQDQYEDAEMYFLNNSQIIKVSNISRGYDTKELEVSPIMNFQADFVRVSKDCIAACITSGAQDEIVLLKDNQMLANKKLPYKIVDVKYSHKFTYASFNKSKLVVLGENEDGKAILEVYSDEYLGLIGRIELDGTPKNLEVHDNTAAVSYADNGKIERFNLDKLEEYRFTYQNEETDLPPELIVLDFEATHPVQAVYEESKTVYVGRVGDTTFLQKFEMPNKTHALCGYGRGEFAQAGMYLADDVTPNDTVLLYHYIQIGVEEAKLNPTRIYPNPANDEINIELDDAVIGDYTLKVMDLTGNLCITKSMISNSANININLAEFNLSAGTYFIKLEFSDKTYTGKFVVGK